jgi:hypothetical protein
MERRYPQEQIKRVVTEKLSGKAEKLAPFFEILNKN